MTNNPKMMRKGRPPKVDIPPSGSYDSALPIPSIPAASDPALGSVKENAANCSPRAKGASHLSCCSGVPNRSKAFKPTLWWAFTNKAVDPHLPAIASATLQ